jgi:site-specific recombinase XerC
VTITGNDEIRVIGIVSALNAVQTVCGAARRQTVLIISRGWIAANPIASIGRRPAPPDRTKALAHDQIAKLFAVKANVRTLIRGGTDLVVVAELLGHARLETVRAYTKPTEEDKAMNRANTPGQGLTEFPR